MKFRSDGFCGFEFQLLHFRPRNCGSVVPMTYCVAFWEGLRGGCASPCDRGSGVDVSLFEVRGQFAWE